MPLNVSKLIENCGIAIDSMLLVGSSCRKEFFPAGDEMKFHEFEVSKDKLSYLSFESGRCNCMLLDGDASNIDTMLKIRKSLEMIDCVFCKVHKKRFHENLTFVAEFDIFLRHYGFRRIATDWSDNNEGHAFYVQESFINRSNLQIPRINLLDANFSHSSNERGYDSSCMVRTARFDWDRTGFGNTEFVVVTDEFVSAKFDGPKIAWLIEPMAVSRKAYDYVYHNQEQFDAIASHDINFLSHVKRGIYCPFGGTWIDPDDWSIDTEKKCKNVSIISSEKNQLEGHKLRHKAARLLDENDRFGKGYKPVLNKIDALRDYRFSIVIENNRSSGYFSEKLIDSLITCTVPIYWGCSEVLQIFDNKGIITFDTIEQLDHILKNTDFESFYENSKQQVISNAKTARRFASVDETFFSCVLGLQ